MHRVHGYVVQGSRSFSHDALHTYLRFRVALLPAQRRTRTLSDYWLNLNAKKRPFSPVHPEEASKREESVKLPLEDRLQGDQGDCISPELRECTWECISASGLWLAYSTLMFGLQSRRRKSISMAVATRMVFTHLRLGQSVLVHCKEGPGWV